MPVHIRELGGTASFLDGPLIIAVVDLGIVIDPVHGTPYWNDDLVAPVTASVQQRGRLGNLECVVVGHRGAGAVNLEV